MLNQFQLQTVVISTLLIFKILLTHFTNVLYML